jgi:hypothetical protein
LAARARRDYRPPPPLASSGRAGPSGVKHGDADRQGHRPRPDRQRDRVRGSGSSGSGASFHGGATPRCRSVAARSARPTAQPSARLHAGTTTTSPTPVAAAQDPDGVERPQPVAVAVAARLEHDLDGRGELAVQRRRAEVAERGERLETGGPSRGAFACTVPAPPSWPVLRAASAQRAAVYVRISSDREGEALGVERQRQEHEDVARPPPVALETGVRHALDEPAQRSKASVTPRTVGQSADAYSRPHCAEPARCSRGSRSGARLPRAHPDRRPPGTRLDPSRGTRYWTHPRH